MMRAHVIFVLDLYAQVASLRIMMVPPKCFNYGDCVRARDETAQMFLFVPPFLL